MNKNYTANELADRLVKLGMKRCGTKDGLHYCWAFGTLTALFDQARFVNAQDIIDRNIVRVEKDLGLHI